MKRQATFTDSSRALANIIQLRAFLAECIDDRGNLDGQLAELQGVVIERLQEHEDKRLADPDKPPGATFDTLADGNNGGRRNG